MNTGEIIIYQGPELQVTLQDDSVWLTQAQMTVPFGLDKRIIFEHNRNVLNIES